MACDEIKVDGVEKDGSMWVIKDEEGKRILGKFKTKREALAVSNEFGTMGKRGPEHLIKED
jgi:phage I-like protein